MLRSLVALIALGSLLMTACAPVGDAQPMIAPKHPGPSEMFHGEWRERPYHLPDETFKDTSGQPFNLRTSPSSPVKLLYFGYPDCPNVCPSVLADLSSALAQLPPDVRDDVQVLVVDLGAAHSWGRKTKIRSWLDEFDPEFVGLLGPPDQVRRAAEGVGVEISEPDHEGVMLHGAHVIAFDHEDEGVLVWFPDTPVAYVTEDLIGLATRHR